MPDIYVKRNRAKNLEVEVKPGSGDESAKIREKTRDNERKIKELASFCPVPEGLRFETQEEREEIILLLRAHVVTNVPWIIVSILMLLAPLVLRYVPVFDFMPQRYIAAGVFSWYLVTVAFMFEQFLNWYFNVYIVTDERIVDVDFLNLLYKRVSDAKLDKIQDVTYSMGGVVRSIFDYGTVTIQTAAEVPEFEFEDVPEPDKVAAVIRMLVDQEEQEILEGRTR